MGSITAADLLNDRVLPFFESHDIRVLRVLTDRGTESVAIRSATSTSSTWRSRTSITPERRRKSPQTNGICERFHKTLLDEFYRAAFRRKIYRSLAGLQADLDAFLEEYNEVRTHQGRWCYGKTPMQMFLDMLTLAKEKLQAA